MTPPPARPAPTVVVGPAADLALDEPVVVPTPDGDVLVVRTAGGLRAVGDRCTHEDVPLSEGFVDGDTVECSAHFARFCLRTGRALGPPATGAVPVWRVEERDGLVHLGRAS